ncbi:MAG: SMC-Scp complex subunit ScpB [Fibrobacterales bacterium]
MDQSTDTNQETEEQNVPAHNIELQDIEEVADVVQALVFAASDTIPIKKFREIIGEFIDAKYLRECIVLINKKLSSIDSPFEMVEQAKGFRFRTKVKYFPWVKKLFNETSSYKKISRAALETLSIIAYKQPITKAEIESVRGVQSCDAPLKMLLEKKLVVMSGRSTSIGGAFQYVTTDEFLKYFNINSISDDLPKLHELDEIINSDLLLPQMDTKPRPFIDEEEDSEADPNQLSILNRSQEK